MLEWGAKKGGVVPILRDGEEVATVDPQTWREGAELMIGDQAWTFGRQSRDRVARLARNPRVVLRATKKSAWRSVWTITGDGVTYEIRPEGFWQTTHRIQRDGRPVGVGKPTSIWSSRATLDLDPSVPPVHQLFLLWISHLIRRRAAAAAVAAS